MTGTEVGTLLVSSTTCCSVHSLCGKLCTCLPLGLFLALLWGVQSMCGGCSEKPKGSPSLSSCSGQHTLTQLISPKVPVSTGPNWSRPPQAPRPWIAGNAISSNGLEGLETSVVGWVLLPHPSLPSPFGSAAPVLHSQFPVM